MAINLESEQEPGSLVAHYAAQLEKAGWSKQAEGQSGPVGWNTWHEEGEDWMGVFFILKIPQSERQHFLYIRAELAEGEPPVQFSNWITTHGQVSL
jgi:hypothetical protein